MSNASKYRKKAVEYEQLKQFDRAVASYVRAIEENENAGEEVDVALFNKVGDLTLRQGRVTEAVTYYERAVEHYVSNSLFDNAIALCNKILRNAPGRSNVYFTLGRICGRKGLRSDATRNFLEYATRMQQEGRVDEGMRALAEVADLMPELTEIRRLVEEHAERAGISLTRRRDTPKAAPVQAAAEPVRSFGLSKDLVFLEIDYDAMKPVRGKTPPPQRSVAEAVTADPIVAAAVAAPAPAPVVAPAQPATARLEDLMIFDPRASDTGAPLDEEVVDTTVVDGASILKPYVDPETPVVSLEDLLPTEFKGTPAYNEAISGAETISDILARGVAPRAPGDEHKVDTPVVVTRVPTVPNFPAIKLDENVVALDGVESGISAELFSELPAEESVDAVLLESAAVAFVESPAVDERTTDGVTETFVEVAQVATTESAILPTVETVLTIDAESANADEFAVVDFVEPIESVSDSVVFPDVPEPIAFADAVEPIAFADAVEPVAFAHVVEPIAFADAEAPIAFVDAVEPVAFADVVETIVFPEVEAPLAFADVAEPTAIADEAAIFVSAESAEPIALVDAVESIVSADAVEPLAFNDLAEPLVFADANGADAPAQFENIADFDIAVESGPNEPIELLVDPSLDAPIEFVSDNSTEEFVVADEIINFAVEQELNQSLPAQALDGFTADEEPTTPADFVLAEPMEELVVLEIESTVEVQAEADVLPSIDFDAMLEMSEFDTPAPQIHLVADLESEEFAPVNDDLAATRFVRLENESEEALIDSFESENDLPPLIFGIESDVASDVHAETVEPIDLDFDVVEPIASAQLDEPAIDTFDIVGEGSNDGLPDLVFLDVAATGPEAFTPIALDVVEPVAEAEFDSRDLDDLFGDTGMHTAVAAAEATLVASTRCAELQAASESDPENFVLRRRLAEALFEAGNRDAAISELSSALAGAELVGALSDAADIADELVRVAGDDAAHHQKRLELSIRLGDQSRLREAYLDFADNLVLRGEDLRAKAVYARVLEMDPWDDRARTALGDAAPPPPAKPAVVGSDEGHVSLADWLRDDDEPVSTRLRMREPDVSGDEQDDFNALLKHFKEGVARSLGEDDYESHYDLGVAYKEMGLLDDAIGEFQMALRSRNNRLAAYEALGQCFLEQQSYKVAVTVLSRALHEPAIQDEQRVGVLYLLGYSCEVLQRFDEARGYFQRVYATDIHFRDVGQRLADLERTVR